MRFPRRIKKAVNRWIESLVSDTKPTPKQRIVLRRVFSRYTLRYEEDERGGKLVFEEL